MRLDQFADGVPVERYDHPDRTEFVADFGPGSNPSVEVLGDTVIIVTGDGRQQEIDVPDSDVRAFNRHGVVTIEVSQ